MIDLIFIPDVSFTGINKIKINNFYNSLKKNLQKINFNGFIFFNLENPIIEKKNKPINLNKTLLNTKSSNIRNIGNLNFMLSNNHIFDYGLDGFKNTINVLRRKKIKYTGAGKNLFEASKPIIVGKKPKVGIFSLSYNPVARKNKYGVFNLNSDSSIKIINKIRTKKNLDKVICYCHSGLELFPFPLYKDEKFYKKLIRSGVDLIVGSHAHVTQPIQIYEKKYIFFSIGDSLFNNLNKTSWNKMIKKPSHAFYYKKKINQKKLNQGYVVRYFANDQIENVEIIKLKRFKNCSIKFKKLNKIQTKKILENSNKALSSIKNNIFRKKIESKIFN